MEYEAVIGLEVHLQLKTKSKVFSRCGVVADCEPNTFVDPYTLGLPGTLPTINSKAIEYAIRLGIATHCFIRENNSFSRKHYFYPDLPKGYQITQLAEPICEDGYLLINKDNSSKKIRITRIHIEEDAGKNIHKEDCSLVDYNRAGVPLLEIVSKPDITSAKEAGDYLRELRLLARYLEISDGNMEEGSLRCDANISLHPKGEKALGVRCEIKNINSFKFVERALEYEIKRQSDILQSGGKVTQETRTYDSVKDVTRVMRGKEDSADYRYMPEPDLPPLKISPEQIKDIKNNLPKLPEYYRKLLCEKYGLTPYDAEVLIGEKENIVFFERALQRFETKSQEVAQDICHWMCGDLFALLKANNLSISDSPVSPDSLAELVQAIGKQEISGKMAKEILEEAFFSRISPQEIIEKRGYKQISDSEEIVKIIEEVLSTYPKQVDEYKNGKEALFGFFVGQVMKKSGGKVNPGILNQILREKLAK